MRGLPGNSVDRDRHAGFREVMGSGGDYDIVEVVDRLDRHHRDPRAVVEQPLDRAEVRAVLGEQRVGDGVGLDRVAGQHVCAEGDQLGVAGCGQVDLAGDLTAGVITAIMLAPQAMAYATLAGMPPVTGLYAALVPLVAYALFGTSGQLAVGPVAMVSLLTATALSSVVAALRESSGTAVQPQTPSCDFSGLSPNEVP